MLGCAIEKIGWLRRWLTRRTYYPALRTWGLVIIARKRIWSPSEDEYLVVNFCLTNEDLASRLGVAEATIKRRYSDLGIDRPTGKSELARARNAIYRERLRGKVPDEWFQLPSIRTDAKMAGVSFFWDGQQCNRSGHLSRRKTSSGGCWNCEYEDHKQKLATNAEFSAQRKKSFKTWYDDNRDGYLIRQRESKRTPESREWYREYERKKRQNDIEWQLAKILRDRLYKAVSRGSKASSAIDLVGCSIVELKTYLTAKFLNGMTWENYGEWHVDHIKPCISFDLTDPIQQQECFHYTNLQPLWGFDNRSKGGIWNGVDPRKRANSKLGQSGRAGRDPRWR